jgi:hypothetical protein
MKRTATAARTPIALRPERQQKDTIALGELRERFERVVVGLSIRVNLPHTAIALFERADERRPLVDTATAVLIGIRDCVIAALKPKLPHPPSVPKFGASTVIVLSGRVYVPYVSHAGGVTNFVVAWPYL